MARRTVAPRNMAWRLAVVAIATAALAAQACSDPTPVSLDPSCPNRIPTEGKSCEPGLSCRYFDPSGCVESFEATCNDQGVWVFNGLCPAGGSGGSGNHTSSGGSGGEGGTGGSVCVDAVAGPPTVTSPLAASYPPDTGVGKYRLQLSESATGVTTRLSWNDGPGGIVEVTKIGSKLWEVAFSGLLPGESALLTLEPGAIDGCGNAVEQAVDIDIAVLPSCHYYGEDFESDFLSSGWTASDEAGDGNVWDRNDALDPPVGVPNHTDGFGICASANDVATADQSGWDTTLNAPPVDLTDAEDVVLRYQSDFSAPAGVGEAWLEASVDGFDWVPLTQWSDSHGPGPERVKLSDWVGGPVLLRWRYADELGAGGWWDVDDVCVESYTQASCPCPGGAFPEDMDVAGGLNGNGNLATAEPTGVVLTAVGDALTVCGLLEDGSGSGADFFTFWMDSGSGSGPVRAQLDYCFESSFDDAVIEVWRKGEPDPIATYATAHAEGSFEVTLTDGAQYYVSVTASGSSYEPADYTVRLEVEGMMTTLLAEGFEFWPPFFLQVSDEDPCLDWMQATETVVPPGFAPTEGFYLAYFNSYDCNTGSEALETGVFNLSTSNTVVLLYDLFHDSGYPGSNDSIQVQYDDGNDWIDIGAPAYRPGPEGWETVTVDLSALGGMAAVRVRLLATTAYGNDTHIDNVLLLAD